MMSEISYHQQQYIRHQKEKRNLFFFADIYSSFSFWCCGKSPPGPG